MPRLSQAQLEMVRKFDAYTEAAGRLWEAERDPGKGDAAGAGAALREAEVALARALPWRGEMFGGFLFVPEPEDRVGVAAVLRFDDGDDFPKPKETLSPVEFGQIAAWEAEAGR